MKFYLSSLLLIAALASATPYHRFRSFNNYPRIIPQSSVWVYDDLEDSFDDSLEQQQQQQQQQQPQLQDTFFQPIFFQPSTSDESEEYHSLHSLPSSWSHNPWNIRHNNSFSFLQNVFRKHLNKFPSYPKVSSFDINNLPDNYYNQTHHVDVVDDHHITVNQTVHKQAEDGFRSFFHKKVIHIRPHDQLPLTTAQSIDTSTEVPTTTYSYNDYTTQEDLTTTTTDDYRRKLDLIQDINVVDVNSGSDNNDKYRYDVHEPAEPLPEVETLHRLHTPSEMRQDNYDIMMGDAPVPAAYRYYTEDEPSKELHSDTNINRIHASGSGTHEGMILAEPLSEIFDLPSVIQSLRPVDEDQ